MSGHDSIFKNLDIQQSDGILTQKMQSDCKQYFGFAVEEFAGITGVSELFDCWAFCLLETVTSERITQESRTWRCSENLSTTNPK